MKSIDLAGFEEKFAGDPDPWNTWTNRDEAVKRDAILHALGPGPHGRVLELAAGNGSNSRALAARALRLDATEATGHGTRLVAEALAGCRGARVRQLVVPAPPPRARYDAIVVAELFYYLGARDMAAMAAMAAMARQVAAHVRPGGTLVLAHHRITFHDFVQHAEGIHDRFVARSRAPWRQRVVRLTGWWIVTSLTRR